MLALHDENEFLFVVAAGGALSAPFVTATGGGTPLRAPLVRGRGAGERPARRAAPRLDARLRGDRGWCGGLRPGRRRPAGWGRVVRALPGGHLAGACALAALLTAQFEWRGDLSRALLGAGLLGVLPAWDRGASAPFAPLMGVSLALAAVTYAALRVREPAARHWVLSALVLPLLSLGVAYPVVEREAGAGAAFGIWAVVALLAWRWDRRRGAPDRGGAHLLVAGVLGTLGITSALWSMPLPMVAALGVWGVALSAASGGETVPSRWPGSRRRWERQASRQSTSSPAGRRTPIPRSSRGRPPRRPARWWRWRRVPLIGRTDEAGIPVAGLRQ